MSPAEFEDFKLRHRERIVAFGVTSAGTLIQRIESTDGTWSLVLQLKNGHYCLVVAGEGWSYIPEPET
ncbi:MAG: hypothetical protein ACR2RF_24805 [Geminicoccaceae bacterium]